MTDSKKVVVGMSGGVDSSAVCLMLKEQGYEVVGVTMRVWDIPAQFDEGSDEPRFIVEARSLARRLGIRHEVADLRDEFSQIVVRNFIDEYMAGRTPNPCVLCNPLFKFRVLTGWAEKLGCAHVATGHYVRTEEKNGLIWIRMGESARKDQSYFLWRLEQNVLRKCLFPLGGMCKDDVRRYLADRGFDVQARQSESMEICFVEGDYRDFLRTHVPGLDRQVDGGWFVDASGRKLGQHKGYPFYTVGQRKGLGIALGRPAYVLKLNALRNTVMLGDEKDLETRTMLVEEPYWPDENEIFGSGDEPLCVRIRYHSRPVACRVERLEADERLLVRFETPVSAVTPGQSAVFYRGNRVVGGTWIASQRGMAQFVDPGSAEIL